PPEKSNLLIVRSGVPCPPGSPPAPRRRSLHQMMFHKIDPQSLTRGESLAQGSFTHIYKGIKREQDEEDGPRETLVVLKVMDSSHRNCLESFLEAASTMSQLSHKHLVLLHGVSLGKDTVMVQEHVRLGPLDLYLRKRRGAVTTGWKLTVAKQLGYALNYLVSPPGGCPAAPRGFSLGLSPGIFRICVLWVCCAAWSSRAAPGHAGLLAGRGVLVERIPWVAPECVSDPGSLALPADKWGFGATLWEIFSGGNMPLSLLEPQRKLEFYQSRQQLPAPKWPELAALVAQCMEYQPQRRPCFRALIRDLNCLISSDYELLSELSPADVTLRDGFWGHDSLAMSQDPEHFQERHLKYISLLGKPCPGWSNAVGHPRVTQGSPKGHCPALEMLQDPVPAISSVLASGCDPAGMSLQGPSPPESPALGRVPAEFPALGPSSPAVSPLPSRQGMEYLGSRRCVHRDLASRNILVESDSHVKIGDFGLAKLLPQDKDYYVVREPGQSPVFWYAPESLADNIFSCASDTWSFGVLLYELFTYSSKSRSPSEEFLRMMGTARPAQIICHLLELLKDNRRLPAPAGCPSEV
ncbi:JAK3 kinase, partial [Leiothrix lutea]|nr:JAK3 kinase [Leiothrix lutea]